MALPTTHGGPLQVRWLPTPPAAQLDAPQAASPLVQTPAVAARAGAKPPMAPASAPPVATAPAPAWPPSGRWLYALQWRGELGEAVLDWQQDGAQYRLRLERQAGGRRLPTWQSEGSLEGDGLRPARFTAGHGARAHTDWAFSGGRLLPHRGDAQAAPAGTQDRLSWMWQLAWQASQLQPRPGDRLQVVVAAWRGLPQNWDMQAERDPEHPHWLLLRRMLAEGSLAEQRIWFDPTQGYLPVRLEMRYDDAERWSLSLTNLPPIAAQAPSSP